MPDWQAFFFFTIFCAVIRTFFFPDNLKIIRFSAEDCFRLCKRNVGRQKDNMTNTSKTKGFLTPVGAMPAYDNDLDTVFRQFIAGVTGLDGSLVGSYWNESLPAPATDDAGRCQAAVVS